MVRLVNHGGSCCGARHLYGFSEAEERNPDLIDAQQANAEVGRRTEVILNGTQVRSRPNTLRRLADLGYVLTEHYVNNNHTSSNFVFSRADRRRPLFNDRGECLVPGWTGRVLTPHLQGDLAPVLEAGRVVAPNDARFMRTNFVRAYVDPNAARPVPAPAAPAVALGVNSRVRIASPTSRYNNLVGVITGVRPAVGRPGGGNYRAAKYMIRLDVLGDEVQITYTNVRAEERVLTVRDVGCRVRYNNPNGHHRLNNGDLGTVVEPAGAYNCDVDWDNGYHGRLHSHRYLEVVNVAPPAPAVPVTLAVGIRVEYTYNGIARIPRGTRGTITERTGRNDIWRVQWDNGLTEAHGNLYLRILTDQTYLPPVPMTPAVGSRVVWNGVTGRSSHIEGTRRARGSLGTIYYMATNPNRYYVEWDHPNDTDARPAAGTGIYIDRDQFTVLTPEEAAATPRVVIERPAREANMHEEAPDFAGVMAAARRVAEVPGVVRVFQTFHNVYRDGRIGAGYDSYAAARDQRVTGRIDRRDIMSDGTTVMHENVAE